MRATPCASSALATSSRRSWSASRSRAMRGRAVRMPAACPSCGTPLEAARSVLRLPEQLRVPGAARGALVHFGAAAALDIEGLGERTARALVEAGWCAQLPDLFDLAPRTSRRWKVSRRSRRPTSRGRHARSRRTRPAAFPGRPWASPRSAVRWRATWRATSGPSSACAARPCRGARRGGRDRSGDGRRDRRLLRRASATRASSTPCSTGGCAEVAAASGAPASDALDGQTFVFTGALERFTRSEAEALVVRLGAKAERLGERDQLLVAGEGAAASSRRRSGRASPSLDEDGFVACLAERGVDVEDGRMTNPESRARLARQARGHCRAERRERLPRPRLPQRRAHGRATSKSRSPTCWRAAPTDRDQGHGQGPGRELGTLVERGACPGSATLARTVPVGLIDVRGPGRRPQEGAARCGTSSA